VAEEGEPVSRPWCGGVRGHGLPII
jgi:hypothetical protein